MRKLAVLVYSLSLVLVAWLLVSLWLMVSTPPRKNADRHMQADIAAQE
jgi:hypothetical protein